MFIEVGEMIRVIFFVVLVILWDIYFIFVLLNLNLYKNWYVIKVCSLKFFFFLRIYLRILFIDNFLIFLFMIVVYWFFYFLIIVF